MLIIVIAAGAAMVLYSSILILFSDTPKQRVKNRLNKLAENVELEYIHDAVLNEKKKQRKVKKKPRLISRRFEDSLAMAGIHISAQEFVTLWICLTLGPGLVGSLMDMELIAVLGICVVGFAIPPIMVQRSRARQQQLFNKQLGESLTIMSNCMRSGYSFQQAMQSISKGMQPPISTEFGRVVREINYGATLEQALGNMAQRVDNADFSLLISAVITSTQVGANLSEILDTISETVTDRIRLREEVRVFSAQGRMSGLIIGLLPVAVILFLMILNPDYILDFVNHPLGKILLIASVFLEAMGFFLINRIVDIKPGCVATAVRTVNPTANGWTGNSIALDMPSFRSFEKAMSSMPGYVVISGDVVGKKDGGFGELLETAATQYTAQGGSLNTLYARGLCIHITGSLTFLGNKATTYYADYPITLVVDGSIDLNGAPLGSGGDAPLCIMSKSGDITVNGGGETMTGILFAPNGNVTLNGSDACFVGRIVAQNIRKTGGKITVTYREDVDRFLPTTKVHLIA